MSITGIPVPIVVHEADATSRFVTFLNPLLRDAEDKASNDRNLGADSWLSLLI